MSFLASQAIRFLGSGSAAAQLSSAAGRFNSRFPMSIHMALENCGVANLLPSNSALPAVVFSEWRLEGFGELEDISPFLFRECYGHLARASYADKYSMPTYSRNASQHPSELPLQSLLTSRFRVLFVSGMTPRIRIHQKRTKEQKNRKAITGQQR